ncbi:MAG TPA: xanthine dehydrogenase family protein molybdopterin-binding subunit, partial [Burkholderiaceae bacterium]|nr:xanthine dehydrogenase family protein molybdopterin-binding subunit [Burkholderiaceae bacterium]
MSVIGQPLNRTDGRLKVTGAARYSAEHPLPRLAHAVLVQSTIPSGRIAGMDAGVASKMPGVLLVMTHQNAPRLPDKGRAAAGSPPAGRVLNLLQDEQVYYNNQPIAVVVADTLDHAQAAARRLRVSYKTEQAVLDFKQAKTATHKPEKAKNELADTSRGDLQAGSANAAMKIDAVYTTPMQHHNPIEPHATIATWEGDHLILYDATQYVSGVRRTVAKTLGIAPEKVRVICPFVGGGFGCKGSTWSHVVLAAMAARQTGRAVKLVLDRPQMFGPVGHRPETEQRFMVAAASDGKITAMSHDVVATTSFMEDWTETAALTTRMLYECPNQRTTHRLARLNTGTPTFMRAPGEATGTFALESALDELAYALKKDPIELRLKNYAENDPQQGRPWSEKALRECYRVGAERFGWSRRTPLPGSMRQGRTLVGLGMATATYPANRSAAGAIARILPDGTAVVSSGSQDLGTGTYTVMTQVAADAIGVAPEKIRFQLGDTELPEAPVSGGSQSAASVAPAVQAAGTAARLKLIGMAVVDAASPLFKAGKEDIEAANGWLYLRSDPSRRDPMAAIIARNGGEPIEARVKAEPGDEKKKYSMHSFGAVFAEVLVDADLGVIRVPRVVAAYDIGQALNRKTAHSQLMGGIVWGIGLALQEKTDLDPRYGRIVNGNLADYHVPVNADIGEIDIVMLDRPDP